MKTVLSSVLVVFLAGFLYAQDVPPGSADLSSDLSGAVPKMQGSADLLLVGSIAQGIGLGFGTASVINAKNTRNARVPPSPELGWVLFAAYAGLTPLGFVASSITYGTLLDAYNRINLNDKQYATSYLLLTIGGAVLSSVGIAAYVGIGTRAYGPSDPYLQIGPSAIDIQTERAAYLTMSLVGVATSLSGIIVSVVHSQELLAKTKSAVKKAVSAPGQQVIVTPQIGIGSFGVAISMP